MLVIEPCINTYCINCYESFHSLQPRIDLAKIIHGLYLFEYCLKMIM